MTKSTFELPPRKVGVPAEQQGLFAKFTVKRNDGKDATGEKHHCCDYFVLDATHDEYAAVALVAYAKACKQKLPELSADMVQRYSLSLPETPKHAPVQGYSAGIPWDMHLRAYDAYSKRYSPQKALIEGGCRGGFGVGELDMLIPGWREELSVRKAQEKQISGLEENNERLRELLESAANGLRWYQDHHPEDVSEADYEMLEQIDAVLKGGAA